MTSSLNSQMSKASRDKKKSVRSGQFTDFTIKFGLNNTFQGGQVLLGVQVTGADAIPETNADIKRSVSLTINRNTGDMTIPENRAGDKLRKSVLLQHGSYTVTRNEKVNGDWIMCIQSSRPVRISTADADQGTIHLTAKKASNQQLATAVASRMSTTFVLAKRNTWFENHHVKYIEILIPRTDSVKAFNIDDLASVFNDMNVSRPDIDPIDYIQDTTKLLDIEFALENEEKLKSNRSNVTCVFFRPAERPLQLHVRMTDGPSATPFSAWSLGSGEAIQFIREGRTMQPINLDVIRTESVFANPPPAIPQGRDMASGWTSKTYLLGAEPCAQITNA